jgi:HAMP domain-containing protein
MANNDVTITENRLKKYQEAEALVRAETKIEHQMAGPGDWLMAHEEARVDAKLARAKGWAGMKERYLAEGAKPMLIDAGKAALRTVFAGAAIYYVATSDYLDKIAVFRDHWWLKPVVVMALGYWLLRRQSPWAPAVLAAGAAMFVEAWRTRPLDPKDAAAKKDALAKKDATTQGPDEDAGHWDWVDDTYGRRGRWTETPSGGRSYVTQGNGAQAAERIAERVFQHARPA